MKGEEGSSVCVALSTMFAFSLCPEATFGADVDTVKDNIAVMMQPLLLYTLKEIEANKVALDRLCFWTECLRQRGCPSFFE